MLSTDVFFPNEATLTPSELSTIFPFKNHENLTGRSPDDKLHCTVVESPKYEGSSPKVKGNSLGSTAKQRDHH